MCFQKNLLKFKLILKILFKNLKGFKNFFESFKENLNKRFEKLNENYNFYYNLFLLLAEAWVVPYPLQLFRGFGRGESFPLPPPPPATPLVYTVQCTLQGCPDRGPRAQIWAPDRLFWAL